ncbi:MAG: SufD family Fe-S cluster assembly protein [Thermodesulfovibrionales bacterium]|nr:SufD family Fe-S cluster assembly protein [Nitrospinota bacterium]MCG2709882.1 SufD family Fe-S cluster assembly protein [Thermodesulfovibrionales bacterium]
MSDLDALMKAFGEAGGDKAILGNNEIAHLVASGHKLLSMKSVEGLEVDARETMAGISAKVTVKEGIRIKNPVHLCFGVLHKKGTQKIKMDVRLEKNSSAHFIAHCIFPNAEKVRHIMDAVVEIGEGAEMRYSETHFHGLYGGIEVIPKSIVKIGKNGRYFTDFTLTTGRVGKLDIDYSVEAGENAVTELTARVFGHANDEINIKERVVLAGKNSRGLIKTRVALEDEAKAEVTGITEGNAEGARGHVDCMEIVKDNATAKAIPIVSVIHPLAKVTHEAAIGSVDKRQMETLMAHGLTPEEAVDLIVKGILK